MSKHQVVLIPKSPKGLSHVLKMLARILHWCQLRSDRLRVFPPFTYNYFKRRCWFCFLKRDKSTTTRLNRFRSQLFLPFKQNSENEQGDGEWHGALEVPQPGVVHARWRTLQVCPRNILWKPKSLTPKPVWDIGSHRGTRRVKKRKKEKKKAVVNGSKWRTPRGGKNYLSDIR